VLLHNEPILRGGRIVGETTSAAYGHTLGQDLALGYVTNPDGIADEAYVLGGHYHLDVGGTLVPATATMTPLYDPRSARVRA
jgi:4-methylaminobutanoate oxidase (formaldehyde-forming)